MRRGFTLLEMSIVLVIIGLITGAVLAGKDLIDATKIRSQVAQFRAFDEAAGAFKQKYNCIPGDCTNFGTNAAVGLSRPSRGGPDVAVPVVNGFFNPTSFPCYFRAKGAGNDVPMSACTITNKCQLCNGDGDGTITDGFSALPSNAFGEATAFFVHLSIAGFIDPFDPLQSSTFTIGRDAVVPKLGHGGITAMTIGNSPTGASSTSYVNGYFLGVTTTNASGSSYNQIAPSTAGQMAMTPLQAMQIDQKIDDSFPTTGKVFTVWTYTGDSNVHPVLSQSGYGCIVYPATTPQIYNLSDTANDCSLFVASQQW